MTQAEIEDLVLKLNKIEVRSASRRALLQVQLNSRAFRG